MVRGVQTEPRTGETLHVDFYQVKMAEEIRVEVPIVLVGEAPVLKLKENMLAHELNTLTVECLPAKIPASVTVDLTSLTESGQAVRVKDIGLDERVSVLNDPELVVVRISTRRVEKVEEAAVEVEEEMAVTPGEESKEE